MDPEQAIEADSSAVAVALPSAPQPCGLPVPAAIFASRRPPPFVVVDDLGDPADIDAHWLDDCEGETVYVAAEDAGRFRVYLQQHLRDILFAEAVPLGDRAWAVHRALLHEVAHLYTRVPERTRPNTLTTICRDLAVFLMQHRDADALFSGLRGAIAYTPIVHAVETAIGTVAIAIADGREVRDYLAVLAAGAAFADAGMLDIPREIREKTAPLSPLEWRMIQRHPEFSLSVMRDLGIIARVARLAVGSHHERWDGSGYPGGLCGEDIPIEGRYVAMADAYASLTVVRRGRPRLSRSDALREMAGSTGQFDPHLMRLLVRLLTCALPVEEAVAA